MRFEHFSKQRFYHPGFILLLGLQLFFALALPGSKINAQTFGYQRLSTETGLTQNSASAIVVDHDGYLWIGTQAGLNRFDGEHILNYQYQAKIRGIHNIAIYDLVVGNDQQLYILGNFGLEQLSITHDTSMLLQPLQPDHEFRYLSFHPEQQKPMIKETYSSQFLSLEELDDQQSESDQAHLFYATELQTLYTTNLDSSTIFCRDLSGDIRFKFSNTQYPVLRQIFKMLSPQKIICNVWDGKTEYLAVAQPDASGLNIQQQTPLRQIHHFAQQSSTDRLCGITLSGDLILLDTSLQILKTIKAYRQQNNTKPNFFIHEALIHQDHVWIGTDPQGVIYRALGDRQFSTFDIPQQPPAIIKNIFTDSKGRCYAYVLNQGLQVFSPERDLITTSVNLPAPLQAPNIFAGFNGLYALGNDQFVLSGSNVFGKYDVKKNQWVDYYQLLQAQVLVTEFSDSYLFYEQIDSQTALVSVANCAYQLDLERLQFQKQFCLPAPITKFFLDNNQLWIGTTSGLFQCQDFPCQSVPALEGIMIKDIRREANLGLMVSTATGLYLFGDSLRIVNQNLGLNNNYIYGALVDTFQNIWVSTNQGLSRINPKTWQVRNYDQTDGISATEFNSYGFWKAADGKLYFSGIGGITSIDPTHNNRLQDTIPLVISAVSINDRLPQSRPKASTVWQLSPEQNTLTFYFQDLLLPYRNSLQFSYQLAGFDQHWITTRQSAARYPQLPPGDYTFRLRLADGTPAITQNIQLRIARPYYQAPWFIALLLSVFGGGLWGIWQLYRRRQLAKKRLAQQRQATLEAERQRISRELHDNMGANTTALIAKLQQLQTTSGQPSVNQLERMQRDAQNILSSLRDTIWVLKGQPMALTEFVDLIKVFTLRLLGEQSPYDLVVNENISQDIQLEASTVVHLKAILQEIIHNIIKHAEGSIITFNVTADKHLDILIGDNGKGFDTVAKHRGQGLDNIRWRAQEIGCELNYESNEAGTKYRLQLSY